MIAAPSEPKRDCQVGGKGSASSASSTASTPSGAATISPAEAVDDGRNAGIGGAHQREPEFDRAQARLREMLVGPGREAEPGVVGDIQHPARTLGARERIADLDRERSPRSR